MWPLQERWTSLEKPLPVVVLIRWWWWLSDDWQPERHMFNRAEGKRKQRGFWWREYGLSFPRTLSPLSIPSWGLSLKPLVHFWNVAGCTCVFAATEWWFDLNPKYFLKQSNSPHPSFRCICVNGGVCRRGCCCCCCCATNAVLSYVMVRTRRQEALAVADKKMLLPYTGIQQHRCLWVGSGCREPRVSTSAPNRWHHLRFSSSKSFKLWPRSRLATRASCSPAYCAPGGSRRHVCRWRAPQVQFIQSGGKSETLYVDPTLTLRDLGTSESSDVMCLVLCTVFWMSSLLLSTDIYSPKQTENNLPLQCHALLVHLKPF